MNKVWGEIKVRSGNQCLDSMGHTMGGAVETYYCHQQGGNQLFRLNTASQLMQYDQCLFKDSHTGLCKLNHCGSGRDQNHMF
jgi:polypeptide N-acetylgalactosaminyltransferase